VKGIQVCSNKGPGPLQRGGNHKNGVGLFKNLLLQNHWANFNQTWHKYYPWVKGIQICSKEGDSPSPRGDNSKRVKKKTLKKSSPEPGGQNQSNFVQIILG
jgi:hypothetical protein